MTTTVAQSKKSMDLLSRLLLSPRESSKFATLVETVHTDVKTLSREAFEDLVALADTNHVIVRGLEVFLQIVGDARDSMRIQWAEDALGAERARINNAVKHLSDICAAFDSAGFDVTVIKSLDHWPDFGSDLDLYTNTNCQDVIQLMKDRFGARLAARSWGDRLARKWNFIVPGLPESVEIHMGRLGQTGEQVVIASYIARRSRRVLVGEYAFGVTSTSERIMISTLQRMYRHFYFRLCDIVDSGGLADMGGIDYRDLRASATDAGIWEGVATYLAIVSDYIAGYRGYGLDLPQFVIDSARFGGDQIYFSKDFLRVPLLPQSAKLYGTQLAGLMRKRELHNTARLGLLPWLATAALVGQKITGSDKGIW